MTDERPPETDDIAALYDRWAKHYDSDLNATRDLCAEALRREFAGRVLGDVVELGCGTGVNTAWLAGRARTVTAVDHSDGMLSIAKDRVRSPVVRFVRHDVREPWPLRDQCADQVIGTLVLEHVAGLDHVFWEAYRALRPGGEMFVCELHPYRQLRGGQAQFMAANTSEPVRIPAFLHDVGEYVNAAVSAGFTIVRLDEWRDRPEAQRSETPRLLAMRSRRPG